MSDHKGKPLEGEIVTPTQLDRILGRSEEPEVPALDAVLERFEQLFKASLGTMNLDDPEGFFREIFGGMDYRIAVKTERGRAVNALVGTFIASLDQFEQVEAKIRAISRERHERYIDRIRAARTALEEQQKLEAVAANARLQRQLEEARVQAEIRKHGLVGRPAPPPPPPVPAPAPPPIVAPSVEEEDARRRAETKRKAKTKCLIDLDAEELAAWHAEEKLSRVKARTIAIYQDVNMRLGEKRTRIQSILDSFDFRHDILPLSIQEFMEQTSEEVER